MATKSEILAVFDTLYNVLTNDRITAPEMRMILESMMDEESFVDDTVASTLTFLGKRTIYRDTQLDPNITITLPADAFGWEMKFRHNAASLSITGATLLNPESYIPNTANIVRVWIEDTNVAYAEIIAVQRVRQIGEGSNNAGYPFGDGTFFLESEGFQAILIEGDGATYNILIGAEPNEFVSIRVNDAGVSFESQSLSPASIIARITPIGDIIFSILSDDLAPAFSPIGVDPDGKVVKGSVSAGTPSNLSYTGSATQGEIENSFGDGVILPAATDVIAGLLLPEDFENLQNVVPIDGTGIQPSDILEWNGAAFAKAPFTISDVAGENIALNSPIGNVYGAEVTRKENAYEIVDPIPGRSALIRIEEGTVGGPIFTLTGGAVVKVGDWTSGYSTTLVNHITLLSVSDELVYAYLSGTE